jgi:hypothetical protein
MTTAGHCCVLDEPNCGKNVIANIAASLYKQKQNCDKN